MPYEGNIALPWEVSLCRWTCVVAVGWWGVAMMQLPTQHALSRQEISDELSAALDATQRHRENSGGAYDTAPEHFLSAIREALGPAYHAQAVARTDEAAFEIHVSASARDTSGLDVWVLDPRGELRHREDAHGALGGVLCRHEASQLGKLLASLFGLLLMGGLFIFARAMWRQRRRSRVWVHDPGDWRSTLRVTFYATFLAPPQVRATTTRIATWSCAYACLGFALASCVSLTLSDCSIDLGLSGRVGMETLAHRAGPGGGAAQLAWVLLFIACPVAHLATLWVLHRSRARSGALSLPTVDASLSLAPGDDGA